MRDYFKKEKELEEKISDFGVIWVRGGNLFVLRQAMKLSGFDNTLNDLVGKSNMLYGGYSAGVCVLTPTLKGMELVDDVTEKPYGDKSEVIWDGLGILNYSVVPHYRSDHSESESVEKVIEYMIKNKILFRALKDGEVIVIE